MIAENIKKFRTEKGITQKELADKLYVTPQAVSRWENKEAEPSIYTVNEIAKIFNITVDVLLGNSVVQTQPQVVTETKYVYGEPTAPVLGVCELCNKPIYSDKEIVRFNSGGRNSSNHVWCKSCNEKKALENKRARIKESLKRRKKAFLIAGLVAGIWIALTIYTAISKKDSSVLLVNLIIALMAFTFISCCLLKNNFIGEMTQNIFSWGFVKMPGVIFSLDLDGIIWLLTIKLLFWILGLIIAAIFGIFAIVVGSILSVFVYPFAIYKNFKHPEDIKLEYGGKI